MLMISAMSIMDMAENWIPVGDTHNVRTHFRWRAYDLSYFA